MPVSFLTGAAETKKEELIKKALSKEKDVEYIRIHPDDPDKLNFIKSVINTKTIFSGKTVIDIVDFDSWKAQDQKRFLELVKNVPPDVYIFVRSQKTKEKGVTLDLPKPWETDKWLEWIERRFRENGLKITKDALQLFFSKVGTNDLLVEREIEKLKAYSDTGEVTAEDVEEVVFTYQTPGYDEFCFAVSEGKRKLAHALLSQLWKTTEPVVIAAALVNHFLDLFKLVVLVTRKRYYTWPDISKISKELNIPVPRVARFLGFSFKTWKFKVINHLLYYDIDKLKEILRKLYDLDRTVKSEEDPKPFFHEFIEEVALDVHSVQRIEE
ncbi:DNA polymerase III subunit delta [Thermotoga sp. KOL6]|uniref:DNA polymerase III subunit delta n=1 Tax=Thermotoga sp. KOL6 TaxID=126741 RepID=UPI00004EAA3A|nr:DNA polymerase III subunit delta [Thermotoga sp. KOL6]PLV58770.1 DNA polymerase III subunit delta [Thermotoga sp. KOL6]CAI44389.1 hypothetical protein [Thermotoga sp. KOL6]